VSYKLMHGPTFRQEAPYTFFLPHPAVVDAVQVGDVVKLGFEYDEPGEKWAAERMWVHIDRIEGDKYVGRLDNEPEENFLEYGQEVAFHRENILDVEIDKERSSDAQREALAALEQPREFWERCLVDDCVLYNDVPVEYLYREEPEVLENDQNSDSGWRIRGRQGSTSDEEMDERDASLVAVGAVLNRDDSWLQLIDSPIGSAFMRDFDSNTYEPVIRG